MAQSSHHMRAADTPEEGRSSGVPTLTGRNLLEQALRNSKREVVEEAMGKGESWVKKLLAGESGVLIADLPRLLAHHGLKIVRADLRCVDAQLLASYETIVRRVLANDRRSLFDEDPE